jgi:hypothetical protein
MTTEPTTESHVDDRLPSYAWIRIERPEEAPYVVAGSEAAVEEALEYRARA